MANINIFPLIESWGIANLTNIDLSLVDVPGLTVPGSLPKMIGGVPQWFDALEYTTADLLGASDNFRNYLISGAVGTEGYKHTHEGSYDAVAAEVPVPDATDWHSHFGLDILTLGVASDADALHTHDSFATTDEIDTLIATAIDDVDFSNYVRIDGSINQLSDITSTGEAIEEAVSQAHAQAHTLLEHTDDAPFAIANFRKLMDGSNADCCHTHGVGIDDFDHNDLNNLNVGNYLHLTAAEYSNFGTLTNGSNADTLHTHAVGGGGTFEGEHNELDGLQGGDPSNSEFYHLSLNQINELGTIGVAEDDDYTDGLFTDFVPGTLVGTAVDRFNEVLGSLAPSPAPDLDDIDVDTGGTTADLSFDASNPIGEATYIGVTGIDSRPVVTIDNAFTNSGDRVGVINASTDIDGTLNEDVAEDAGSPNPSYPANAFGSANLGILVLELNGVEQTAKNIDLTNASAQDTTISDTSTGLDVVAATSVSFPGGDTFDQFKYRTGTYHVESGDMRLGWNYMRIIHRITSDTTTNYIDWVVDGNVVDTTYSNPVLDNLVMTGSSYLSGVRYHEDGTADYDIDIDNAFRNTYQTGDIITFSGTNGTISAQSLGNSSGSELLQVSITDASFNVSSGRKLDASIIISTSVSRTFDSNEGNDPGGTDSIVGLLMDDQIAGASGENNTAESFNAEGYRQESTAGSFSLTNTVSYASGSGNGPAPWTNTESLVGADAGHNNGLLQYSGALRYPTQGVQSGDFRNNGDGGPGCEEGYAGNPNYSAAMGDRVYLRYFYVGAGKQNFTFILSGGGTSFVSVATGVSSNNLTLELLVPNTTQNGVGTIEFKDCFSTYTDDNGIGCYSSGTRDDNTSNWLCTSGTRATSSGGNSIVIRITAFSSWTGNISSISVSA